MALHSNISWTHATWNPTTGCSKVSAGCENCYAERLTKRFEKRWGNFSTLRTHPDRLSIPMKRRIPTTFFVNSMSDLFHDAIPLSFLQDIFAVMNACPHHIFQVLTKRTEGFTRVENLVKWTPNIWLGATVENSDYLSRVDDLRKMPASIKFLSFEPLLGSVKNVDLTGIDWVIVGGESGPHSRPMNRGWVEELREVCLNHSIPFFFKQWGGSRKSPDHDLIDGKQFHEMPELLK